MSELKPCPKDAPVMIAWEAYKASDDYANTRRWALHNEHVDGSLWAAFFAGFDRAAIPSLQTEPEEVTEAMIERAAREGASASWLRYDELKRDKAPIPNELCDIIAVSLSVSRAAMRSAALRGTNAA